MIQLGNLLMAATLSLVPPSGANQDSPLVTAARARPRPTAPPTDLYSASPLVGKPAPELEVVRWFNTRGQPLSLARLRGRPVLVVLWSTYCAPCIASIPKLMALEAKLPDLAIVMIHPNLTEEARTSAGGFGGAPLTTYVEVPADRIVEDFVSDKALTLPVGLGTEANSRRYGAHGVPQYTLIDGESMFGLRATTCRHWSRCEP